jgi:hypothetical protein
MNDRSLYLKRLSDVVYHVLEGTSHAFGVYIKLYLERLNPTPNVHVNRK